MIKQVKNPCTCVPPKRNETCHAGCAKYKEYHDYCEEVRIQRGKEVLLSSYHSSACIKVVNEIKKKEVYR